MTRSPNEYRLLADEYERIASAVGSVALEREYLELALSYRQRADRLEARNGWQRELASVLTAARSAPKHPSEARASWVSGSAGFPSREADAPSAQSSACPVCHRPMGVRPRARAEAQERRVLDCQTCGLTRLVVCRADPRTGRWD